MLFPLRWDAIGLIAAFLVMATGDAWAQARAGDPLVGSLANATGIPVPPPRPVFLRRPAAGRTLRVPEDHPTVAAAVAAARPGDIVLIADGDFRESIVIDKSISLIGAGPELTRLHGLDPTVDGDSALVISPQVSVAVENLSVQGCDRGIFVHPAGRLELRNVHVLENRRDGVYMEQGTGDVHTCLVMERCLVSGTADGVDFMGGQGHLIDCDFRDNSDDGVDVDGDSGVVVAGCRFFNNGDDGIEVRLRQRTYVFAIGNEFAGNDEDGFEVIDTYLSENGIYNVICLQDNRFGNSQRFDIAFVDQQSEKDGSRPASSAVFLAGNSAFDGSDPHVTDNYRHAVVAAAAAPVRAQVTIGEGSDSRTSEHEVTTPLLVGVYDFKAMTDGTHCLDTEGVAVSPTRVYVADDDAKAIYVVDRFNGDLLHKIPMAPIRGSQTMAKGPEGVHVIHNGGRDEQLWVADDDGGAYYRLSLTEDSYGQLLEVQSTSQLGPCEGIALLGDRMLATRSNGLVSLLALDGEKPAQPTLRISTDAFGGHVAGVGVDPQGTRVFVSTNGYHPHDDWRISWRGRDQPSGVIELNPELDAVKRVWNLGPFCDDARGVDFRDGLLYVVCGRQQYTDERTGEIVRNGEKVFVFAVDDGAGLEAIEASLALLPLRCGR